VTLNTSDNQRAAREIAETFRMKTWTENGGICIEAEKGDELIPKLIQGLSVETRSVGLKKPTLNDVFLRLTGRTIRDEGLQNGREVTREFVRSHRRAQR
jgi:ABC-2 type transport system ATP-binding protein